MKRIVKIEGSAKGDEWIREGYFSEGTYVFRNMPLYFSGLMFRIGINGRYVLSLVLLIFFSLRAVAPESNTLFILEASPVNPFSRLLYATAMVETMMNPIAYNEIEQAAGILQIRQIRIDEYNRLTGNKITLKDVFNPDISEKIFLFFASRIGPYRFEKIARDWNGSGPKTELYWKRVKKYL